MIVPIEREGHHSVRSSASERTVVTVHRSVDHILGNGIEHFFLVDIVQNTIQMERPIVDFIIDHAG